MEAHRKYGISSFHEGTLLNFFTHTYRMAAANRGIVVCSDTLAAFVNFTGQCWSDSAAVFLLFSAGVGTYVQEKLRSASVVDDFSDWIRSAPVKSRILARHGKDGVQERRRAKENRNNENYNNRYNRNNRNTSNTSSVAYKYITEEEYDTIFVPNMIQYMDCLKQRYMNMASNWRDQRTGSRRRRSCALSLCKEESGATAANILLPQYITSDGTPISVNTELTAENRKAYMDEYFKYRVRNITRPVVTRPNSYQTRLERAVANLEKKTDENIERYNNTIEYLGLVKPGLPSYHFGSILEILMEFCLPEKSFKSIVSVDDINDDESSSYFLRGIPIGRSISDQLSFFHPSAIVSAGSAMSGHALAFFTCDGGSTFVYDDNLGFMKQINWHGLLSCDPSYLYYIDNFRIGDTEEKVKETVFTILRAKQQLDARLAAEQANNSDSNSGSNSNSNSNNLSGVFGGGRQGAKARGRTKRTHAKQTKRRLLQTRRKRSQTQKGGNVDEVAKLYGLDKYTPSELINQYEPVEDQFSFEGSFLQTLIQKKPVLLGKKSSQEWVSITYSTTERIPYNGDELFEALKSCLPSLIANKELFLFHSILTKNIRDLNTFSALYMNAIDG